MTTTPHLAPEALAQRYALLCESTRPEPDEHMLAYSVEQGLQALDKLLTHDLRTLARQGAPDDFADIHQALLRELERLREFCAFPALANKLVVAFGGGFSAGKSSLINALLGRKLMVTEVDPTTSLPTYVLCGERDEVSALNLFGHRVALTEEAFLSLTHDEPLLYGSHISRLLRAAFMTRADFPWQQLALIDTPGYSKDQSNGQTGAHSERTDEHIARAQLNAAQAVVWVIDARQGCITEDDLAFLGSLQRSIPLFIALSRADQKPEAEIPGILSVISAALKGRNIPVVGMAAFSARKTRAWPLEPLLQQFKQWNEQAAQPQLAHSFQAGFARYDQFLAQQHTEAQDELNRLNRILALSDHREAQAEATHLKARAQTRLQALKEQGRQLEALWQTFGTQLVGVGKQVGMALPAHGVLRPIVANPSQDLNPDSYNGAQNRISELNIFPKELAGAIYIQWDKIGIASYHFEADGQVYINWDKAPVRLDNNLTLKKKYFSNVKFDSKTRTFSAELDFNSPEMTTAYGNKKWLYTMVFSPDFKNISGGQVLKVDLNEKVTLSTTYCKEKLDYKKYS